MPSDIENFILNGEKQNLPITAFGLSHNVPLLPDAIFLHLVISGRQFLEVHAVRVVAPTHTLRNHLVFCVGQLTHALPVLARSTGIFG
jgi:hypothetical protein